VTAPQSMVFSPKPKVNPTGKFAPKPMFKP
jgi:hypothetical protein